MQYSLLGRTGLNVSRVCLGTMTWGQQNAEAEGHQQLDYAQERGINFIDTAEIYAVPCRTETYGHTEKIIGRWLSQKQGIRDQIVLATKVAGSSLPWVRGGNKLDGENIRRAIDSSLKRLCTDYVDLYQLHWPERVFPHFGRNHAGMIDFAAESSAEIEDNLIDILTALDEIVKVGKVRYVGLSDDTAWGIMKYLSLANQHTLPRMQSIQNEYSLLDRSDDPYVAEVCVREDVAYLPWSPLATGLLSGKYQNHARPEGSRWALEETMGTNAFKYRGTQQALDAVEGYLKIAKKYGLDVCQMALKFCDLQNFVTSTIIGATTMEQLKSNIDAFDLELSSEIMSEIDAVYRAFPIPF